MTGIPQAPLNVIWVQLDKKFYDTVQFPSGIILYKDTTFHPEETAMSEAKVVSLPRAIQDRLDYAGMLLAPISQGDTILIRYDVVFHYSDQPDDTTPIYKNVLLYNGEEYWRVDIQQVFGILRKGYVEMVNGYILCDPEQVQEDFGRFILPEHFKQRSLDCFRIRYVGQPIYGDEQLHGGDRVIIPPGLAQHYETDWGDFHIIKQSQVLARLPNIA